MSQEVKESKVTKSAPVAEAPLGPLAVIQTGGKQYVVSAGQKLLVEKLEGKAGDAVTLSDVLLLADGTATKVGTPLVSGATVKATIVAQRRMKVINFKKQRRTGYLRTRGHRQYQTEIKIEAI